MKQTTIIGNWKMNLPYNQATEFAHNYFQELSNTCNQKTKLIICPSHESLSSLVHIAQNTTIEIGAQNCSAHQKGAYTSQVSSFSLSILGIAHCIIGHSEARAYLKETDSDITQKLKLLFENNITPIVCIGESIEAYKGGSAKKILSNQLEEILQLQTNNPDKKMYIAYEPIWAIGTGIIPDTQELETIFMWLHDMCPNIQLLYGGSVNENNIDQLKTIAHINGFLIGGASTDFQKLKKIVLSVIEE